MESEGKRSTKKSDADAWMEEVVALSYFYDFYGELLNEHHKRIFEDYILNDMSLSEIASETGISRQGVYDIVKRCSRKLHDYEEKLGLVKRFLDLRDRMTELDRILERIAGKDTDGALREELEALKSLAGAVRSEL